MHLINDILDLASVEAGYMRLDVSKFDVQAMMNSVVLLLAERAREHEVGIVLECPAKIGKITGDKTRLKQVLYNLLSNAVNFSEPGQKVSLGVKENEDSNLLFWVEDEGQGIPHEEQEAVFSKFYKGKVQDAARSKSGQRSGTGLGLSIVKSFVELHGGQVSLVSQAGRGTRLECRILRNNPQLEVKPKGRKKVA
jgi:signal transduction histidine kinase